MAALLLGVAETIAQTPESLPSPVSALELPAAAAQAAEALQGLIGGAAPVAANPPEKPQQITIPVNPSLDPEAVRVTSEGGMVSVVVRDAPLRNVLAMLAETQKMNLVFASPSDVPVTASLDRVPLERALDCLLAAAGYTWVMREGVIFVSNGMSIEGVAADIQGRRVQVFELDFASAMDLDLAVKGMLSPIGKSWTLQTSPTDNKRTLEAVVVEDIEPSLARIGQYISEADLPPRQVLIEAQILEVELSDDERCGVNLNAIAQASGAEIALRGAGFATRTATPGYFIEATGGDLTPLIEALQSTRDAKSLAAPRLLALNGQESRIQIGEQLGFRVTTTTQTSTLESVEFLDVGVVLLVTPRITRDGRVLMKIKPEVSSGQVNPETGLPQEATTEVETSLLLGTGQGMVIGGLIQEGDTNLQSKVPWLGDIPYAGWMFRRRQTIQARSEIIVAITPHVLPYDGCQEARNQDALARVRDPLFYGALQRNPRSYEPRLRDTAQEVLDRHAARFNVAGFAQSPLIRRLPSVEHGQPTPAEPPHAVQQWDAIPTTYLR